MYCLRGTHRVQGALVRLLREAAGKCPVRFMAEPLSGICEPVSRVVRGFPDPCCGCCETLSLFSVPSPPQAIFSLALYCQWSGWNKPEVALQAKFWEWSYAALGARWHGLCQFFLPFFMFLEVLHLVSEFLLKQAAGIFSLHSWVPVGVFLPTYGCSNWHFCVGMMAGISHLPSCRCHCWMVSSFAVCL